MPFLTNCCQRLFFGFFGTLEFSARTLHLRGDGFDNEVVNNLLRLFTAYLNAPARPAPSKRIDVTEAAASAPTEKNSALNPAEIEQRLSRIEYLLERVVDNKQNQNPRR